MYISAPDETTRRIVAAAFPGYRGRKIQVVARAYPIDVRSSWSGGSRSTFVFVRLSDFSVAQVPTQSAFDRKIEGADAAPIPEGFVCAEHVIFCGKDLGVRIHVNPANLAALLPAPSDAPELNAAERVVLACVCGLKSAYRRDAAARNGIGQDVYDIAKLSLLERGLLSRQGGATPEGRNLRDALKLRID